MTTTKSCRTKLAVLLVVHVSYVVRVLESDLPCHLTRLISFSKRKIDVQINLHSTMLIVTRGPEWLVCMLSMLLQPIIITDACCKPSSLQTQKPKNNNITKYTAWSSHTVTIHRSHTWSLQSTRKRRYGGSVLVSVCDSFARSYVPQGWLGRYQSLTTYMVYTNTSTNLYCHLNKAPLWQVISDCDGHWLGTSFHLLQLLRI
jgi:hypothetical protein